MSQTKKQPGRPRINQLTPAQAHTLVIIKRLIARHHVPPTMKELAEAMHINGASAYELVGQLVRKGYLTREPRKARTMVVVAQPPQPKEPEKTVLSINQAVRLYFDAFSNFRDEFELTAIEEQAYRVLETAQARIDDDVRAKIDDLPLMAAIPVAHSAMEWALEAVPKITWGRPLYQYGQLRPLNNTIIIYFNYMRKLRTQYAEQNRPLRRAHEVLFLTLQEAFRRIEKDRNANVSDLFVLESVQKVHALCELPAEEVPHIDVSRRYEGQTLDDGIDERERVRGRNAGLTRKQIVEQLDARGEIKASRHCV